MDLLLSPHGFWQPELSIGVQAAIRGCYGVLLLLTLALVAPQAKRFLLSERWGGYGQDLPSVNIIQNPFCMPLIFAAWVTSAACLICGQYTVAATALNLIFSRYFFVAMRWKGCLRGFGAPGFMTYWLAMVVFLMEFTTQYAPEQRSLAILVGQVDFAFIMLSAGIYKLKAGYAQNNGMEYGMVNPQWGYWWRFFQKMPPQSPLFQFLNFNAWFQEILAAVLMLIPETRFLGGMIILLSFVFIATQIRLGVLCEVVIACCFLFFHPGSAGERFLSWVTAFIPGAQFPTEQSVLLAAAQTPQVFSPVAGTLLMAYLVILPLAHAGLFYNFYSKKALPKVLQVALEKYTNFFGIIVWRVFSADHTNFFPQIYQVEKSGSGKTHISHYGWKGGLRFNNVGECITLTCLFTTLKYYASNQDLFNERLLRYARTLPCREDCVLVFEYNSIKKESGCFSPQVVAKYIVDTRANSVQEILMDEDFSVHATSPNSPVAEGIRPGSYVRLGS